MLLTEHLASNRPRSHGQPEILLRMPGLEGVEKLVPVLAGRTTIGSSPRCTIPIQLPGVDPLHCLITRDTQRLTVRRWAAETRLNGEPFEDATLAVGDWLSLGPVDLEVIEACVDDQPAEFGYQPCNGHIDFVPTVPKAEGDIATDRQHSATPCHPVDRIVSVPQETMRAVVIRLEPSVPEVGTPCEATSKQTTELPSVGKEVACRSRGVALARTRSRKLLATLRRDRDARRQLQERIAVLDEQLRAAAAARNTASAELHRTQLHVADLQQRAFELDSLLATHQQLREQHENIISEKAGLLDQLERLGADQSAARDAVQTLTNEREALAEDCRRLVEENARHREQSTRVANERAALAEENERGLDKCNQFELDIARLTQEKEQIASQKEAFQGELQELTGECDRLRREHDQFRNEIAQLASEKAALVEHNQAIAAESAERGHWNERFQSDIAMLTAEKALAASRNVELARDVESLASERKRLCEEHMLAQKEIAQLNEGRESLENTNSSLTDELNHFRQEEGRLRVEVAELNGDKSKLLNEQAAGTEERERLRLKLAELENEVTRITAQHRAIAEQNTALVNERDRLLGESTQVWDKVARLSDENKALAEAVPTFVEERDRLSREVSDLHGRLAQLTNEHAALADGNAMLTAQHDRQCRKTEAIEEQMRHAAEETARSAAVNTTLVEECHRLQQSNARLCSELAQSTDDKMVVLEEKATLAKDNTELIAELSRVQHQLLEAQQHIAELADRHETAATQQQQLDDIRRHQAEAAETISRLEKELADERSHVATNVATIEKMEQWLAGRASELADATAAFEGSERQLRHERQLRETLETQRDLWQNQQVGLESEVTRQLQRIADYEDRIAKLEWELAEIQRDGIAETGVAQLATAVVAADIPELTPQPSSIHLANESGLSGQADAPCSPGMDVERFIVGGPIASSDDHDESMEAYMARMWQRIRGESSQPETWASEPAMPISNKMVESPGNRQRSPEAEDSVAPCPTAPEQLSNLPEARRREPQPERKSDIQALRSLANDTTRRTLGTHFSRTYRRRAITKSIVAMLAGATSLWLLLGSPSWLSLTFATACVTLVATIYWAVQTLEAILQSIRAGSYEGKECEETIIDQGPIDPSLPIDVIRDERS